MIRAAAALALVGIVLAACAATPGETSGETSGASSTLEPEVSKAPAPAPATDGPSLVGKWTLDRTCDAIVAALTQAGYPDFIPVVITELLVDVPENGPLPSSWNPAEPCADAKPPTAHSHTFWPNGTFNSYDENGRQVDDGQWKLLDDSAFAIGDQDFLYTITGDSLHMEPAIGPACSSQTCIENLRWAFSVSYPGQAWKRVTTGPFVP